MLVICPIFDRVDLLPFYLRYYKKLGATQFVMAIWNGHENKLCHQIKTFKGYPIEIRTSVECKFDDYNGPLESVGLNKIVDEFSKHYPWYCLADLDEFCYFQGMTMPEAVKEAESKGFEAIHGVFYDRFAKNYKFPEIRLLKNLDSLFPLVCDMTRCHGANNNKVPLAKSSLKVESGHHWSSGKAWPMMAEVHHFKWSSGLMDRLCERDRCFKAQGLDWAGESARMMKAISETPYLEDPDYRVSPARKLGI